MGPAGTLARVMRREAGGDARAGEVAAAAGAVPHPARDGATDRPGLTAAAVHTGVMDHEDPPREVTTRTHTHRAEGPAVTTPTSRTVRSASPSIEVGALTVRRGRRTVLDDLTCAMQPGRVTGLLGPSGAGKTTLMRAIVGTQRIAGGTVSVLGLPAGHRELRRRIGYVTQAPSIYRDISVRDNVRYFARVIGADASRADELLRSVGLAGYEKHLAGNLSGGQSSRVSLACALVGSPDVLVLDEPTVGQDPLLREELWEMIRERSRAGATVLVSSHVMDEAERCEDIVLLREGALLATGTPAEIRTRAGADSLDAAFLALIRGAESRADGPDARSWRTRSDAR